MTNEEDTTENELLKRINEVDQALYNVYCGNFQYSKSKQYSALALKCQHDLIDVLTESSWRAKQAKIELKTVESKAGIKYRKSDDKKPPESAIQDAVNADPDVKVSKISLIDNEKTYEKYEYLFNMLKEAHIFFRNLDKDNV